MDVLVEAVLEAILEIVWDVVVAGCVFGFQAARKRWSGEIGHRGAQRVAQRCAEISVVSPSTDPSNDPIAQVSRVEVEDEADPKARESEVGQKLSRVHITDLFHRLDLEYDGVIDDEIHAVSGLEDQVVECDGDSHLACHLVPATSERVGQAGLVR